MERIIERIEVKIPAMKIAKRVAAYARVSGGKDAMLHSLSAQVSYYSSYIQSHNGWEYCGVYSDEAKTGTKDSRSGFQQLLAKCKAGEIDMVITKSVSRFARNTVTLQYSLAMLCGIDKTTIYSIIGNKSRSPEVASIKKICDGLGITLGEFFSTAEFDNLEQEIQ